MTDFQNRVIAEKSELDEKLEKLCSFKRTQIFAGLPVMEQERMNLQSYIMLQYSSVLGARIAAFV